MSTVTVQREFKALTRDLRLTTREARKLMQEARKGGVTVKEAELIRSYAKRAVTADPRVVRITKDGFFASKTAVKDLEAFADRYGAKTPVNPFPTGEQLKQMYTNLALQRLEAGEGVLLAGPPVANPNDYPSYDLTPEGLQDVTRTLFVINDHLIYRQSGWGPNGISSRWSDLGPAPTF
jgi:hypothetical protein